MLLGRSAWDNVKERALEAMGGKRHGEALTLVKEWLKDSRLILHTTHRSDDTLALVVDLTLESYILS
jgi:hypothetical protein